MDWFPPTTYGGIIIKLDPATKAITRQALIGILNKYQKDDETCEAVKLIEALYVTDPSPEMAREIIGKFEFPELEVFSDGKRLPEA